jgi:hypothetical protein
MSSPLRKASMSGSSAISSRATSGHRPQIAKLGVVDDVRRAYRTGSSIAALARAHRVSRGAIRTAVRTYCPADRSDRWPARPTPHLCRPTHRRGDSDRPGAVTSSPVGGMTALLARSRALRGAPE